VYDGIVQELIDELGRLPGIGSKSAQRIAFHILQTESFDVSRLSAVLIEVREKVKFCDVCGNVSEDVRCAICRDPRRDPTLICVVEEAKDVVAIERTREFKGLYHVLGGALSPIDGIGPDDLRVAELMTRLADGTVTEVIIATDPNLEGEATATYLSRLLSPMDVRVSRLASGLPVGGDLEYADEVAPEDLIFEGHGIKVLVDPKSLPYIDGTELDFVREGLNEGFKFHNPREKDRCGCGESFRI